jgi:hypothetical protein
LFCFAFSLFLFVVFLCLFLLVFIVGNTEFYANSRFFHSSTHIHLDPNSSKGTMLLLLLCMFRL